MLETVNVESVNPLTFHISDVDPSETLICKSVSGLTSAKVGLFTGDYAGEGSYYQGRRAEKLTPVITLKLNPDYEQDIEVSDLREMLYRSFYEPQPDLDGVLVSLEDDRRPKRYFVGYTEDINTDMWAEKQEVQISMLSMDGYLFSYDQTSANDAIGWATLPVAYDGSARCGFLATLTVKSAATAVTLELNGHKMVLTRAFAVNDVITIDTRKGSRAIKVNGTDIMAALSPTSTWLQLDRPNNTFKAYGLVEGDGKAVLSAYIFRSAWWGV